MEATRAATKREFRAITPPMTGLPFTKMHGLGNDFVVFDARRAPLALDAARVGRDC